MTDQETTAPPTSNSSEDASSIWTVLARDIALLAAVLSLFAAADA